MIKYDSIGLTFGNKTVFSNFSLEISEGQKAVIWGKSGLGKTSLFSLLLGFVRPSEGKIFFNDSEVNDKTIWGIRRSIALVDQSTAIGSGNVADWFELVSSIKANSNADFSKGKILELFNYFELEEDILAKEMEELSGGEKQRVAIITSALLKRPVFLLDEATAALDENLKKKTVNYFCNNPAWTVMAISHDPVWKENPNVTIFDLEEKKWKR